MTETGLESPLLTGFQMMLSYWSVKGAEEGWKKMSEVGRRVYKLIVADSAWVS